MGDKGKWVKLHIGWDDDPHIDSLGLDDQARWCKFSTYMKEHGTEGTITLVSPSRVLQHKFRVFTFDEVLDVLRKFPNFDVGEKQNSTVTHVTSVTVSIKNWLRYQGDYSGDRVRKFRAHVTAKKRGEEKRGEETRREEKKSNTFARPTLLEIAAFSQSQKLNIDPQRFFNYYEANGWKVGRNPMKDWKAAARNWKPEGLNVNASKPANAFVASSGESAKYDDLNR